jgi:hypothetical protein
MYDQVKITSVNSPGRSRFAMHMFMGAMVEGDNERIIDCTSGPHIGDETFRQYLVAARAKANSRFPQFHGISNSKRYF